MSRRASKPETRRRDDIVRSLLGCSVVLLAAALLARHHLEPAKRRWRDALVKLQEVEAEIDGLERSNRSLEAEILALAEDPVYRERLLRQQFRFTSSPEERILKLHP